MSALPAATNPRCELDRGGSEHLVLRLGEERYAFPVCVVREIVAPRPITPVPRAPSVVLGVMNLRGRIVPVIDLRRRLGLPESARTREWCLVLLECAAEESTRATGPTLFAAAVDAVCEVAALSPSSRVALPAGVGSADGALVALAHLAERPGDVVFLLDPLRILRPDESVPIARRAPSIAGSLPPREAP